MNQLLAGLVGISLAVVLWSFGKNPKKSISSQNKDPQFFLSTNPELIETTEEKNLDLDKINSTKFKIHINWEPPKTNYERVNLKKILFKKMQSSPEERLEAISLAGLWGNSFCLQLIKRGLKDSDSRVVIAAAAAIKKYRFRYGVNSSQETTRPPRNVSLMR